MSQQHQFVVQFVNTTTGQFYVYGPFRMREAAEAMADNINKNYDYSPAFVSPLQSPGDAGSFANANRKKEAKTFNARAVG